jgi:hypothetical protein
MVQETDSPITPFGAAQHLGEHSVPCMARFNDTLLIKKQVA